MVFNGISMVFKLTDEQQYETIGRFWDELSMRYGLENLMGLGYNWRNEEMSYAIGLKHGDIEGYNASVMLPDDGWINVKGETNCLKALYDEIYQDGSLTYEIETFYENGMCKISYFRGQ